jgi:protoporphyrinogen oxidase
MGTQRAKPGKVVVVGAGPAGLTAAAELVGTGHQITILEQDQEYVGGISRTVEYKGFRFDIGGHRFFSKNPEIVSWWQERLPSDFLRVKRQSRILYRKKFYDYPLRPANALGNLGIITSFVCVFSYLVSGMFPIRPEKSFEDWVSNRFGRKLFNIFFKTYTEKVWGMACSEISADWASQRIKGLSLKDAILHALRSQSKNGAVIKTLIDEFQYPRLGPGMMWEKTRDDLMQAGVDLKMGRKVSEIFCSDNKLTSVRTLDSNGEAEDWPGDDFIFSMPLRDTVLGLRPNLPETIRKAASNLKYRDFITVALIVKGENLFSDNWIYVHDPSVLVGRVQNFNNWSPAMVPVPGVTCLGLEYFCTEGDNLWEMPDANIIDLARREATEIGLIAADALIDACVVRMEKAYPVYDADYKVNVAKIRSSLSTFSNLQVVGRNGMHKYNNQDHSMMTALLAARNVKSPRWDPWRVNTDAEYHEAGPETAGTGGRLVPVCLSVEREQMSIASGK